MRDLVHERLIGNLPIPEEARAALRLGVPEEVRLAGWLGPTVFSSGVSDGHLEVRAGEVVLGAIRETEGTGVGRPYAEFRLRATGEVVLVDLDPDGAVRPVNASLPRFWASLEAFVRWWDAGPGTAEELTEALEAIEPGVLDHEDGYWATWVEEMAP